MAGLAKQGLSGTPVRASGFLEAIADAVKGLDHFEALVNRLELLAAGLVRDARRGVRPP